MATTIGIDVHRDRLMIAAHDGAQWEAPHTEDGLEQLVADLRALTPTLIVLEPSGGYERTVLAALPVARVHPGRVRYFARSHGIAAKSDRLDARVLAHFGGAMAPRLTPAPSPARAQAVTITTRRRQVQQMRTDELRRRHTAPPVACAAIDRHIAFLDAELAGLEQELASLVAADPDWPRTRAILTSVPGIGAQTASLLLATLPELGQLDAKEIAALVGVAPFTQQSGEGAGTGKISGGREAVRTGLWMPTLTARRHNPVIAAFAARLDDRGKSFKVVTTACLRKLLTILNALIAKDQLWNPEPDRA